MSKSPFIKIKGGDELLCYKGVIYKPTKQVVRRLSIRLSRYDNRKLPPVAVAYIPGCTDTVIVRNIVKRIVKPDTVYSLLVNLIADNGDIIHSEKIEPIKQDNLSDLPRMLKESIIEDFKRFNYTHSRV